MKRLLLIITLLFFTGVCPVVADEIEDDYLDIATNYCIVGDYQAAMNYLDKILAKNPNNSKVMSLKRGLAHVMSKDKKSFIENVNPTIKQAMEYKKQGNEEAEYNALIAATKQQNSYLAYYYLGNFYRSKFDYKRAIDAYNASTSARSDFAPAYLSMAVLFYDIGRSDSVLNPIDKYLSFNPGDDFAYALKSRAEFQLGMLERSRVDNEKALQINSCPEYLFDKAKILYKEGDYQGAKNLFSSLLSDIQTSKIYEYMGLCDYAMGHYNDALLNYDKSIILSDDDEYLEAKYNEVKSILESKQYEKPQEFQAN